MAANLLKILLVVFALLAAGGGIYSWATNVPAGYVSEPMTPRSDGTIIQIPVFPVGEPEDGQPQQYGYTCSMTGTFSRIKMVELYLKIPGQPSQRLRVGRKNMNTCGYSADTGLCSFNDSNHILDADLSGIDTFEISILAKVMRDSRPVSYTEVFKYSRPN